MGVQLGQIFCRRQQVIRQDTLEKCGGGRMLIAPWQAYSARYRKSLARQMPAPSVILSRAKPFSPQSVPLQ